MKISAIFVKPQNSWSKSVIGYYQGPSGFYDFLGQQFPVFKAFLDVAMPQEEHWSSSNSVWETSWNLLFTSAVDLLWLDLHSWLATLLSSQELFSEWILSQYSWMCLGWFTLTLLVFVLFGSLASSYRKCFRVLK